MKIKCSFCNTEFEKQDKYIQRCPSCGFFFENKKSMEDIYEDHWRAEKAIELSKEPKPYWTQGEVKKKSKNEFDTKSKIILGIIPSSTFAFTGKLNSMTRKEAEALLDKNGHTFRAGVSTLTDYLVAANPNSNSNKLRTAKVYGTKIITEKEFLEMMD